jgi:hypothetical protein
VALPRGISERLFILCDTTIEGEPENVSAIMAEMSRDEFEAILAEAVTELVDASFAPRRRLSAFKGGSRSDATARLNRGHDRASSVER